MVVDYKKLHFVGGRVPLAKIATMDENKGFIFHARDDEEPADAVTSIGVSATHKGSNHQ